jgi:hypothetical protein
MLVHFFDESFVTPGEVGLIDFRCEVHDYVFFFFFLIHPSKFFFFFFFFFFFPLLNFVPLKKSDHPRAQWRPPPLQLGPCCSFSADRCRTDARAQDTAAALPHVRRKTRRVGRNRRGSQTEFWGAPYTNVFFFTV